MLDELLEYKEYIDKDYLRYIVDYNKKVSRDNDRINNRLKYIQMVNKYSGLKRAFKIIAKYFLCNYNNDSNIALNALLAYVGMEYDHNLCDEINGIANYINKDLFDFYLDNCKENVISINNIMLMKKKFNSKEFKNNIIDNKSDGTNKISFEKIILTMKRRKINRKVLVCKEDIVSSILNNKNKKINDKQKDYILKLIAAYYLYKGLNNKASVILADIYNWSLYNHDSNDTKRFLLPNGNNPIIMDNEFGIVRLDLDNSIKDNYCVLDYVNVKDNINYGDIVYVDRGSKDILKRFDIENANDIMMLLQELNDIS